MSAFSMSFSSVSFLVIGRLCVIVCNGFRSMLCRFAFMMASTVDCHEQSYNEQKNTGSQKVKDLGSGLRSENVLFVCHYC
jgi:hypothetical protein